VSVVKINAIEVPEGAGAELEKRFAVRAGAVENSAGFESFQLLRPTEGETRYFVVTQWESEEAFQGWLSSRDFAKGHANAGGSDAAAPGGGHPGGGHPGGDEKPVSTGASLLSFEVVEQIPAQGA
jgi:heme-degrading monooxygenase HmoA